MRRAAAVVGLIVGVVILAAVVRPFQPARKAFEVATVTRGSLQVTVELAGSIAARDTRTLAFGSAGTVARVLVQEGDAVAAGALLAALDGAVQQAQLDAAEAAVASAETRLTVDRAGLTADQLASARDPVTQAERALTSARTSRADVVASNDQAVAVAQDTLDAASAKLAADQAGGADPATIAADQLAVTQARGALDAAKLRRTSAIHQADASVSSAAAALSAAKHAYAVRIAPANEALLAADEATLASARASATAARAALGLTELRAPIAGIVGSVGVAVGDRAGAGPSALATSTSAGTITVLDLTELRVNAAASEIDVVSLTLDQPTQVTLDALSDTVLEGRVCEIAGAGRSDAGVVAFPVTICLASPDPRLRVGMSANASIVLASAEDTLVIPAQAIRTIAGRSVVEVVTIDGSTREAEVTLGISSGTRTQVLGGLNEGDRVALRPASRSGSGG